MKKVLNHATNIHKKVRDYQHTPKILYIVGILILLFIPMYMSWDIRSTPDELPVTDDFAENSIQTQIRSSIAADINSQFAFLPPAERDRRINAQMEQYLLDNKAALDVQREQLSAHFKNQFQDENGQTYLIALDPYYFFRFVRNIVNHGYAGEYLNEDGLSATRLQKAPTESIVTGNEFHIQFSVFWHKFVNFFTEKPLETTFFFVPVLIVSLAAIPAFFLGRRLAGNLAGLLGASIIVLHPAVLGRTIGGFSDTDSYNILFPLLIFWFIIEAVERTVLWQRIAFGAGAGIVVGIYAYAWAGWWFTIVVAGTGFGAYLILEIIRQLAIERKKIQNILKNNQLWTFAGIGILLLIVSLISVTLITGDISMVGRAVDVVSSGTDYLKAASLLNEWPNVFTTVAELNSGSLNGLIHNSGVRFAKIYFYLAILGGILLIFRKMGTSFSIRNLDFKAAAFIIAWFWITVYMTLQGIRFSILFAPAFAIGLGVFFGITHKFFYKNLKSWLTIPKWVATIVFSIIILLIISQFHTAAARTAEGTVPGMNDDFYNMLIRIQESSQPDAIISSWWDFGHQFITIGQRGATADGASQNGPQSVWLGTALLTDDPEEFVGISRMLNCDSNGAYEKVFPVVQDSIEGFKIVRDIVALPKEQAIDYLEEKEFIQSQIENVTLSTHCDHVVESFWIASQDMIGKASVWGHFGSWNFTKSRLWNLRNDQEAFIAFATQDGMSLSDAQSLLIQLQNWNEQQGNGWIAPYPNYRSGSIPCSEFVQGNSTCLVNIQIGQNSFIESVTFNEDFSTVEVSLRQGNQRGFTAPKVITYPQNSSFFIKEFPEAQNDFGINFFEGNGRYSIMLAHEALTTSMFTRMYFYNGLGLEEYLIKTDDITTVAGQRMAVYKRVK